ncbi:MAG: M20 family metallopeptidase, partial [Candidatus Bathyarchaeia archaeon]
MKPLSTIDFSGLINPEDVTELTSELVRIPSVTGKEGDVAEFISEKLAGLGFDVRVYEADVGRPNVVGTLKGTEGEPTLILNGHMDTVPPGEEGLWSKDPYGGEISGGRVYGRGSCDMKGGLACMLTAVEAILKCGVKLRGDLIYTAVVDEEGGGLKGTKFLVEKGVKGDYAVIGEPTELEVQVAHKGDLGLELTVKGRLAHAATPELGLNAIHKMLNVGRALLTIPERFRWDLKRHRLVGSPTIGISVIEGGIQRNMVPDRCKAIIDRRVVPSLESLEEARAEVESVLNSLKKEDNELNVELRTILDVEACEVEEDKEVVKVLKSCVRKCLGIEAEVTGAPYFT